ncbi:MAG: cell division protein FtsZ [Candidatus Paceibacterota bacterium]
MKKKILKSKSKNILSPKKKSLFKKPIKKSVGFKKAKPKLKKTKVAKKTVNKNSKTHDENFDNAKKIRIRIVGIGGGGSNIVSELSKKLKDFSSQKIDFLAVNTDNQALNSLTKNIKTFSFGQKLTRGLGTGRDVELGERAAREDYEKIKNLLSEDRDLYVVISSLGGGTGTGSSPVFSKAINDLGIPVLGIFTMPFVFEGKKKMDDSLKALEKMKEYFNAYMILPNEKIFGLVKEEISFTDSLNLLNSQLANSLDGLLRAIYSPGLINIDWADIKTILEGKKKLAYLNVVKGKTNQNIDEFIKSIFKNPILDSQFSNAENIMFNIEGSKDLSLQILAQISDKINELSPNAKIIFGINQNPKMKNEIKVTILATINQEKNEKNILTGRGKKKSKNQKQILTKKEILEKSEKTGNRSQLSEKPIEIIKKQDINKKQDQVEEEKDIRRNALEAKEAERRAIEKEEEDEKIFEIPAFLRKDNKK